MTGDRIGIASYSFVRVSHTLRVSADLPAPEIVIGRLSAAGCVAADEEAVELLAATPDAATLETWIRRRERGEPLAWITGTLQFCGHTIQIARGVYVPRLQSEQLARRAAHILSVSEGKAVDLCSGSGAVAVHLRAAVPASTVLAVDIDPVAATCARRNGVVAIVADLDQPLVSHAFDVVTAVAPYVPTEALRFLPADVQRYEPRVALDGGGDGLDIVRRVVTAASRLLRSGGWLLIEVGGDQDVALHPSLAVSGFGLAEPWFDDDGDLRGLAVQKIGPATERARRRIRRRFR